MQKNFAVQHEEASAIEQAVEILRQFRRPQGARSRTAEYCELCSAQLQADHPHLVELASRQLVCACDPCAMLFDGMEGSKYKRVSRRIEFLQHFQLTNAQWEGLYIPINLAFFVRSSIEGRMVALYPSPAGAIESLLSLESWNAIVNANPSLQLLESDVEALLVNRVNSQEPESTAQYFIAPVDECYKLVGLIRANWKGLSGGTEVWTEVQGFFNGLRARAYGDSGRPDA